jgi:hypothetical protein
MGARTLLSMSGCWLSLLPLADQLAVVLPV